MPKPIKILIIGNGFGGTYALKELHKLFHNNPNVELFLVGEKNYFLFTPLLHEVATGGINPENIIEPIRSVLTCCLKNFYEGLVEIINTKDRTVKVGEFLLPYDYLILAPGATTNFYGIPGAEKYSFPLKSLDDAIKIKNHCIGMMERAADITDAEERRKILKFVIVGGGPTGVELSAELQELIEENFSHYYSKDVIREASVTLIQRDGELVPQFSKKIQEKSLEVLRRKKVNVLLNKQVKRVDDSLVTLNDDTKIPTKTIIWVAGIKPAELQFDMAVNKSDGGQLIINQYLQLTEHKEIFVIGDAALFMQKNKENIDTPLPALAQVAEKEAKAVAKNIKLLIKGVPPEPFLYSHTGNLMSIGRWMAVGEVYNFTFWGGIAWWIWRMVYLTKLISWRKKLEVAFDWTINIFSSRDISQI